MLPQTLMRPNGAAENKLLTLSRKNHSDLKIASPAGLTYLPFQPVAVEFGIEANHMLIGDPPGVGKTIQSIAWINHKKSQHVIVICPAAVVYNWKRELERWLLDPLEIEIFNPKTFNPQRRPNVLIVSYFWVSMLPGFKKVMSFGKADVLVIDECQFLKNPNAQRTKYVLAENGVRSLGEKVIALSGTPIVNRPMDLFPVIKTLCPKAIENMNRFQFGVHYCAGFQSKWGWNFEGASNLDVLGLKLRSNFMLRRKKEEILKDLPEKFPPNLVYIDPTDEAKKLVRKLQVFEEDWNKRGTQSPAFEEISIVRRLLGEEKKEASAKYISTLIESGHPKIVVFAHHQSVIDYLFAEFEKKGFKPVRLTGRESASDKNIAVRKFQELPEHKIFLGSITAGGVGINLTAASYLVFVEFSWVPGENEQAIDRIHRVGQTKGCMVDYLVYENSLDERILKILTGKQKVIGELLS